MKIGFLSACLGDLQLQEKVKWASENGFKAIEVACWPKEKDTNLSDTEIDVALLTEEKAVEIKKLMKDNGVTISSLAYYENNLDRNHETRKAVNEHVKKCIDAAVLLGTHLVGTFVGRNIERSIPENFDEYERVFSNLVQYAEDRKIKLMVENCPMEGWQESGQPGTISFTPELWEEMFRRIPSRSFGLNFDPSHLFFQLIDYIGIIPLFKDRIFHMHAKDTEIFHDKLKYYGVFNRQLEASFGNGYWRYRMPGMGQIEWGKIITELKQNGYDGFLSIEHEDPLFEGSTEKIKEGLLLGKEYLEKFI